MNDSTYKVKSRRLLRREAWILFALALLGAVSLEARQAQENKEKKIMQTAGVDNTKMGPYRALAQLTVEEFQKGDNAKAAELARILERTWDQGEERGGEHCLIRTNKALFEEIDKAMDVFIKPILHYAAKTPDAYALKAAYIDYLDKLKKVEE